MFIRALAIAATGAILSLGSAASAQAQLSGRVIIEEGPIGVDVVFGPRPSVVVEYGDRRRYEPRHHPRARSHPPATGRRPVRYERGMSLVELERYLSWIEAEYRYFRRLHPDDAYYHFGWTEYELHRYVDWLKHERRFLREELKHFRKIRRRGGPPFVPPGHRIAPGRGRGGGGPWRMDDDAWEDRYEDWEDALEDRDEAWEDRYEDWEDSREDRDEAWEEYWEDLEEAREEYWEDREDDRDRDDRGPRGARRGI